MTTSGATTPVDGEIARVTALTRSMMRKYIAWGSKYQYAPNMNAIYGDMIDFVNFRMETAESCLLLIENSRVADALGLSRGLLENYLLFMLMCRGTKYFKLSNGSAHTPEKFQELFKQQQEKMKKKRAAGESAYVDVVIHPRLDQHLQHIFEGVSFDDGLLMIPYHYFQFREFRPEVMRLRAQDYFEYFEHEPETKKALKRHRSEARGNHRHYLAYSALLDCLELNGILDTGSEKRVEAHFTFLGQFVHPTHDAGRELHEGSNVHSGKPTIGMDGHYSSTATLLASVYCCYLVAGFLDELMGFFEKAPAMYMTDPATMDVRAVTQIVPSSVPYFWFIFNEAPLYDRFIWAIHHVTDKDLARYGHYSNVPSDLIAFNQQIYAHFRDGLGGWGNRRVGDYQPNTIAAEIYIDRSRYQML
jgi:hypothetical protein